MHYIQKLKLHTTEYKERAYSEIQRQKQSNSSNVTISSQVQQTHMDMITIHSAKIKEQETETMRQSLTICS